LAKLNVFLDKDWGLAWEKVFLGWKYIAKNEWYQIPSLLGGYER
jgi:hypothetical protein